MHPLQILKSRAPLLPKQSVREDPAMETDDRVSEHHHEPSSRHVDEHHPAAYAGPDYTKGLLHLEQEEEEEGEEGRSRPRFFFPFGRYKNRSATAAASSSKSNPFLHQRRESRVSIESHAASTPSVDSLDTSLFRKRAMALEGMVEARNGVEAEGGTEEERCHCERAVTFGYVHVREYNRILGDHPACSTGPPLALGWDVKSRASYDLEVYEKTRNGQRRGGPRSDMRIGSQDRRNILLSLTAPAKSSTGKSAADGAGGLEMTGPDDIAPPTYLYTVRDLRRAERHLNRDRNDDRCIHDRTNERFFRSMPSPPKHHCHEHCKRLVDDTTTNCLEGTH